MFGVCGATPLPLSPSANTVMSTMSISLRVIWSTSVIGACCERCRPTHQDLGGNCNAVRTSPLQCELPSAATQRRRLVWAEKLSEKISRAELRVWARGVTACDVVKGLINAAIAN